MADGVDLVRGLQNAVLRIDKDGQDSLNGFGMRGHGDVALDLQTGGGDLVCQLAIDVDALAQALGETSPEVGSISWYFSEELPALITRIFMVVSTPVKHCFLSSIS